MGATMRAVRFGAYGGPDVLEHVELERPQPAAGEVLLRVAAIGVNPADHKFRAGALAGHRPKRLPLVPGMDVAGEVVAAGAGVDRLKAGDRVFGMLPPSRLGGYADHVAASAGFFAILPDRLPMAHAAALPTAALTGVEMVEDDLDAQPGQRLLVIGGLGGVGRAAAWAGRRRGCHVTVAVRPSRRAEVDFADSVIAAGEAGSGQFDVIADTVGGDVAAGFYASLVAGGVLCSVSTVRLPPSERKDILARNFVCYPDSQRLADLAVAAIDTPALLQTLEIRPLSQVASVHAALEAGDPHKFVLVP